MGLLDKAKDLYKMQRDAKKIKEKLKNIHIEAEEKGVKVIIDGHQEVQKVLISDDAMNDKNDLQSYLIKAFNKAIKKSQEIAATEMKAIMGEMGLA